MFGRHETSFLGFPLKAVKKRRPGAVVGLFSHGGKRNACHPTSDGGSRPRKAVESGRNVIAFGSAITIAPFIMAGVFAIHLFTVMTAKRGLGLLALLALISAAVIVRAG